MNNAIARALMGGAIGLALAGPAAAQQVCGAGQPASRPDPAAVFRRATPAQHVWGAANVTPLPDDGVRVAFARGSVNPADKSAPSGGAGFELPVAGRPPSRCLHYQVRFAPGFDFAKGGKLPGLYGGDAPRGCSPEALSSGFSARLMWRTGGAGELYLYAPGRTVRCGDSVDRGAWTFTPGQWTAIAQEVALNTPGRADGRVRIWVDGRKVIDRGDLTLREQPSVGVDGLLFATFFGGNDPSWASPQDQFIEFRQFGVWDGEAP